MPDTVSGPDFGTALLEKLSQDPCIMAIRLDTSGDPNAETDPFSPINAVERWLDQIRSRSQQRFQEATTAHASTQAEMDRLNEVIRTAKDYQEVQRQAKEVVDQLSQLAGRFDAN